MRIWRCLQFINMQIRNVPLVKSVLCCGMLDVAALIKTFPNLTAIFHTPATFAEQHFILPCGEPEINANCCDHAPGV